MTIDSEPFEVHRWHSTEYVDSWMANKEREEDRSLLRTKLVSLLPFEPQSLIRVLDLGAGGGALSQEILSTFPKAQIICQDFSEAMLNHAKQHLPKFTNQVTYVCSDLSAPEWTRVISDTFDAVVSSLVMHTVPSRISEIYREVYGLVKPGGCFLIADSTSAPGPVLEKDYLNTRLKTLQAAIKAETGVDKSREEIELELKERRRSQNIGYPERVRNPLRATLTLENHMKWLREAGFDEVDCLWKEMRRAIIGGFKQLK